MRRIPLGWLQLWKEKARFGVAISGVAFAVVLILVALGFRESMFESATRYHSKLLYDIALFSPESQFIVRPQAFSRRRLYQALAVPGVQSVSPVYIDQAVWKNPITFAGRAIFVIGFDPADPVLDARGVVENFEEIKVRDVALFDEGSRPEFGPIVERFRAGSLTSVEVNDREIDIAGLFEMGSSFGIDGALITSDVTFLRLFPGRLPGLINLGLIRVEAGGDVEEVRAVVRRELPADVLVLTKPEFIARERAYWGATTPIGYVFALFAIVGFVVGTIIVYQILFANVSDHRAEYATLKAMGHSNAYLSRVVLEQALILAVLGYIPGYVICTWLYQAAAEATQLPIYMTHLRAGVVLLLTISMCVVSGVSSLRLVRKADPADIF